MLSILPFFAEISIFVHFFCICTSKRREKQCVEQKCLCLNGALCPKLFWLDSLMLKTEIDSKTKNSIRSEEIIYFYRFLNWCCKQNEKQRLFEMKLSKQNEKEKCFVVSLLNSVCELR